MKREYDLSPIGQGDMLHTESSAVQQKDAGDQQKDIRVRGAESPVSRKLEPYVPYDKYYRRHHRGGWRKTRCWPSKRGRRLELPATSKEPEVEKFIYGNFPHYYGYRNQDCPDMRLSCMKREWFEGKDVLDIGCNAGHFTLSIARDFSPKMIIGIDIDRKLVQISKKNAKHYMKEEDDDDEYEEDDYDEDFPISFVILYGPLAKAAAVPKMKNKSYKFPCNAYFLQANYILDSDDLIKEQKACFDTVLCLSLTKWIHLNWGDVGIKRLFHRAYAQLRPGGYFILEAQPYSSYGKKKKVSPQALKNYMSISLYPESFNEFLLKEVGFEKCELVDVPAHTSKGFSRPIYLFTKSSSPAKENISLQDAVSTVPTHIVFNSDDESSLSEAEYSDVDELSD